MSRYKDVASSVNENIRSRLRALETNVSGLAPPSWRPMPPGPFIGRRVEFILKEVWPGESVAADIVRVRDDVPTGEVVLRLVLDSDTHHQGIHPIIQWAPLGNEPGCWRPLEHERQPAPPGAPPGALASESEKER